MIACPKERKCIELTFPIIRKSLLLRIKKLKEENSLILGLHQYRIITGLEDSLIADKEKPLRSLILLTIAILLYPLFFADQLIDNSFFNSKKKKEKKILIQKLLERSEISYEVSEFKSFLQLWSDKGLRDFGLTHMEEGPYSDEDKYYCLSEWIKILYDENFDLNQLRTKIRDEQTRIVRDFYETHSPLSHITPASEVDLIPFEIDIIFGGYKVDEFTN